jgi:ATP-dependent Clp protease ATP-binding subunit ClpA
VARVFDAAEKAGEKAGDSYVTVERLLLALALEKDSEAGKLLKKAGVTPAGAEQRHQRASQGPHRRQRVGGERL